MDKSQPPETFGVFKPVGHIVISYRWVDELQFAAEDLLAKGFAGADIVRYSPGEMVALVDAELRNASPLAAFGYEIDQIKANRTLAQEGCSFLVVKADNDARAALVAEVAGATRAVGAQRYGTFVVEELVDKPD